MPIRIQYRKGLSTEWVSANPVLAAGEPGYELDTGNFKVGNGVLGWNALSYCSGMAGTSGTSGISGLSGVNGDSGTSGSSGTSGTSGVGTSGTSGLTGTSGTSGITGENGTSGTSGTSATGAGTSGTSGITGSHGTSGTSGSRGSHGTSGTSGGGTSGTSGTSGVGTSGTSGTSGVGTSGTSGTSGNGTSGTSGIAGTSGTSGVAGTSGTSGLSGVSGTSGTSGLSGTAGSSGTSSVGTSGTSGISGIMTCKQSAQGTHYGTGIIALPGMYFDLTANHRYKFYYQMVYQAAAATTGVGFAFTCGTLNFINWNAMIQSGNNATAGTNYATMASTSGALGTGGSALFTNRTVAANQSLDAMVQGLIQPVGNTRLQLFFRSNGSGGAASLVTLLNQGAGECVDVG